MDDAIRVDRSDDVPLLNAGRMADGFSALASRLEAVRNEQDTSAIPPHDASAQFAVARRPRRRPEPSGACGNRDCRTGSPGRYARARLGLCRASRASTARCPLHRPWSSVRGECCWSGPGRVGVGCTGWPRASPTLGAQSPRARTTSPNSLDSCRPSSRERRLICPSSRSWPPLRSIRMGSSRRSLPGSTSSATSARRWPRCTRA